MAFGFQVTTPFTNDNLADLRVMQLVGTSTHYIDGAVDGYSGFIAAPANTGWNGTTNGFVIPKYTPIFYGSYYTFPFEIELVATGINWSYDPQTNISYAESDVKLFWFRSF